MALCFADFFFSSFFFRMIGKFECRASVYCFGANYSRFFYLYINFLNEPSHTICTKIFCYKNDYILMKTTTILL